MKKIMVLSAMCLFAPCATSYASHLTPYAAHWCIDASVIGCAAQSLLDWQPSDVLNQFYAQQTPFAKSIAMANETKPMQIIPFVAFNTAATPAQMAHTEATKPQISFWQYMQRVTYFGGSQSEGQVLAPEPGWIKAAHQNGVRILGSIFFSPTAYGGDKELAALNNMLNNPAPYVTQLVTIAKTLGFDGYFINNEADESKMANDKFAEFIEQFHAEAKKQQVDLSIDWYQVPAYSVRSLNKNIFVNNEGAMVADNVFLDYGWLSNASSISAAVASWNYPLSALDFGIYDVANPVGASHQALYNVIFPKDKIALGSVSEFAFEDTLIPQNAEISLAELSKNEAQFWLGTTDWIGGAAYVPMKTTLTALPFSASFNLGQGEHYFVDGRDVQIGQWQDMGQQDRLPTWRFHIVNTNENALQADFDYADGYSGGSSLLLQGKVHSTGVTTLDLYAAAIEIKDTVELDVISKTAGHALAQAELCLHTTDAMNHCYPIKPSISWGRSAYVIDDLINKTVDKLFVQLSGESTELTDYTLSIGHLFLGDSKQSNPPDAPTQIQLLSNDIDANQHIHHYVSWQPVSDAAYYRIYSNGSFVARTSQTIFDVIDTVNKPNIVVTAVNGNELESARISVR